MSQFEHGLHLFWERVKLHELLFSDYKSNYPLFFIIFPLYHSLAEIISLLVPVW